MERNYAEKAKEARKAVLGLIYKAQTSHIGSNFSCIDILTVLFDKIDLSKDKIIFSKGWVAASAYYFLSQKGILNWDEVYEKYCDGKSPYIGLVEPTVPGIIAAGGSVGYGIPFGVGFALAKKIRNEQGRIYILESDGALQTGQVWESMLIAAHHHLNNLVVLVDRNNFQATGQIDEILKIPAAFDGLGWYSTSINGHDYQEIEYALDMYPEQPFMINAHTIKGKGISWMENQLQWHYKYPNDEEYKLALKELCKE